MVPFGSERRAHLLQHTQNVFRPGLGVLRIGKDLDDGASVGSGFAIGCTGISDPCEGGVLAGLADVLVSSRSSVTVVTAVMLGTMAFNAMATAMASVAAVGAGVLTTFVNADAGPIWAVVGGTEQPVRRTAATAIAASSLRTEPSLKSDTALAGAPEE